MSKLRIFFSASWFLLSLISGSIWYSILFESFAFSVNEVDKTKALAYFYLALGLALAIVELGVYWQKKSTLLAIVPLLILSIAWFTDVATAENLWLKNVLASGLLFITCTGSIFSIWQRT